MSDKIKILVLEDSAADAELVHRLLSSEKLDFEFNLAGDKDAFLHALDHYDPTVILADNSLPQFSAKEALEIAHQRLPNTPFILVTGSVSEEFAAGIIKLGADDYILKDRMRRLPAAIDMAIKQQKAEKEKREAQDGFRKSNERFQTLSRVTKDAIWDWNLLTGEIWWNESFYNLLGYDPNQPVPDQYEWIKRVHHEDRNKIMARLKGITGNGIVSWEDEFRLKLSNGAYGTVLDRAYVLKNDKGEPVRVIGALVDITEQKRLIREMEVISLIARKTNNSVLVFNRLSGYTSWVNQSFTRFTGYAQQDLDKKDLWSMLKGPNTDQGSLSYIAGQIKNNVSFSCEILIYAKNGEPRWQSMNGAPMKEYDTNAPNYFVIATDISDRKKIEEEHLMDKIEQQKEVSRKILGALEMQRNELGRELHDNIGKILAAVNLRLAYYMEEPEGNLDIVEICRKDLNRAIQETRNLAHHKVMPAISEKYRDKN